MEELIKLIASGGMSGILGGITGIIGSIFTTFMQYKTQKMQNEHDIEKIKQETEAMKAEAAMQIQVTKAQIEGAIEIADSESYLASQKVGNQALFSNTWVDQLLNVSGYWKILTYPLASLIIFLFGFVEWLRGFMRPFLTIYLTFLTTAITYLSWHILQKNTTGVLTVAAATALWETVTSTVIYLTVSCVTWWFGDRAMAKAIAKNMNKRNGTTDENVPI
jgi:hypothetical protein